MKKKTWVQKMNEIIEEKKANGMTGLKVFAMPSVDNVDNEVDVEAMAEAFCMIEQFRNEGVFDETTSQTL